MKIILPPPTPGPGGCTAGSRFDPCTGTAHPGLEVDGYPACEDCVMADQSYWTGDEDEPGGAE